MEMTGSSRNQVGHDDEDYSLVNFMDEANFEQFLALISGENDNTVGDFCHNCLDCDHIIGCSVDGQLVSTLGLQDNDHFNNLPLTPFLDPNSLLDNSFPNTCNDLNEAQVEEQEQNDADEYSSATFRTAATPTKSSAKGDRSRTVISERRRRRGMKDKLYALRALVPNITKMDKASIVGDAAIYVQELQMQAKKLKAEIASLESSFTGRDKQQGILHDNANMIQITNIYPTNKKILQIDVFQVEGGGYYVRIVSNKGQGVAVSLYKALESFSAFTLQSSNLATLDDTFLLTFTLNVREGEAGMNLANLKLWVAGALLNQGFDFRASRVGFVN